MAESSMDETRDRGSTDGFIPDLPSEDWEFNILLDDIASQLTSDDVKRLKAYCIGERGTGKKALSEIQDGLDLFTHLRYSRRLSRDNIIVLQAMLFHLKRIDLLKKTIEYTKQVKNVLHFYTPSDKPENGYRFLKVHVVGTENFDCNKRERLRAQVARLLTCPVEFVYVNGMEATNSILVTFMVPEECIDFISSIDDYQISCLKSEGIDMMEVDGKFMDLNTDIFTYNQVLQNLNIDDFNSEPRLYMCNIYSIVYSFYLMLASDKFMYPNVLNIVNQDQLTESRTSKNIGRCRGFYKRLDKTRKARDIKDMPENKTSLERNKEMQSLLQRNKQLEAEVDEINVQLIRIERDKEKYKTEKLAMEHIMNSNDYLTKIIQTMLFWSFFLKMRPVERLSTTAAKATFNLMLQEVKKREYDENIIKNLLESNAQIIVSRMIEDFWVRYNMKDIQLEDMASRLEFLQYEKDKLEFYLRTGEKAPILSEREEFWLRNIANRPFQIQVMQEIAGGITKDNLYLTFSKLSEELKKSERQQLIQAMNDKSKRLVAKSPNLTLEKLWEDDCKKTGVMPNSAIWIQNTMKSISRPDLIKKFHEMAQSFIQENIKNEGKINAQSKASPTRCSPSGKQRVRRNSTPGARTKQDSDSGLSSTESVCDANEQANSLTEFQILNARMQKMESALDGLVSNIRQPAFSSFPKARDNSLSSISSYISK